MQPDANTVMLDMIARTVTMFVIQYSIQAILFGIVGYAVVKRLVKVLE